MKRKKYKHCLSLSFFRGITKFNNYLDFVKIAVFCHNSTLILIESGYCYFYQKPQYFWAFQRFKADLGSSRERPFLRLWVFQPTPAKLGFVEFFLGSLILWVGSLVFRVGSLDYRLFGHATERNPHKHWNPDPWTDRIVGIQ